jgi:hypothetical protein
MYYFNIIQLFFNNLSSKNHLNKFLVFCFVPFSICIFIGNCSYSIMSLNKILSVIVLTLVVQLAYSQKPFVGKLVYSIEIADTSMKQMFPASTMTIYSNDTILRVETKTETLGQQVLIHHLTKKKAYLLIESPLGKFAIQIPEETSEKEKYTYKKAKGKKTVCQLNSSKLNVSVTGFEGLLTAYYHKKISAKYIPGFEHFPGLPTSYQALTTDGIYQHELIQIQSEPVSKDLFGIPSDYQRISMSEFVDLMTGGNEGEQ